MADDTLTDPRCEQEGSINLQGLPVKICVGQEPDTKQYYVHADLLTANSAFFKAALEKNWKEAQKHTISLPSDNSEDFYIYVQYLYTGKIHLAQSANWAVERKFQTLTKLYCLGEKLIDPDFQDTVMDAIIAASRVPDPINNYPTYPTWRIYVNTVYDGTPSGSPMRRLLVDMTVAKSHGGWQVCKMGSAFSAEYLADLCAALITNRELKKNVAGAYSALDEGIPSAYHKGKPVPAETEDGAKPQEQGEMRIADA